MGVVLRAHDPDFDRPLAVKTILTDRADDAAAARRFWSEARMTGRLQHPGIPPVHEIGRLEDGRPFFAMKLIEGQTLGELLSLNAHQQDASRLLDIFENICQTIAYAHQLNVIHRDLKPSNVMVGAFGEVQVMDWGLAKELTTQPDVEQHADDAGNSRPSVTGTQYGMIMGTPAYMSPEQARGDVSEVDAASDVFSLGAILCEILTGHPPFRGSSPVDVVRSAAAGDCTQAFQDLEHCEADSALIELTRRCLAPAKQDRLQNVSELVEGIQRHREQVRERLRAAELARVEAEAKAVEEARRRQVERHRNRLWVSLSMAVLLLVVVGAVAVSYVYSRRAEDAQRIAVQMQSARQGLLQVTKLRREGSTNEARIALQRTQPILENITNAKITAQAAREQHLLELLQQLDDLKFERATLVDTGDISSGRARVVASYRRLFEDSGYMRPGDKPEEVAKRISAAEIRDDLLEAIDYWVGMLDTPDELDTLLAVARLVDPHEVRDQIRTPALWLDPEGLTQAIREVDVQHWTPSLASAATQRGGFVHRLTSDGNRIELDKGDVHELLTRLVRYHPQDFWLARQAGMALAHADEHELAAEYYRSALALRPNVPQVMVSLARALKKDGQPEQAMQELEQAAVRFPQDHEIQTALADHLQADGDLDEALVRRQEAARLAPDNAQAAYELGKLYHTMERIDEAELWYHSALEKTRAANSRHFGVNVYVSLALLYHNARDNPEKGLEYIRPAIEITQEPSYVGPRDVIHGVYAELLFYSSRYEEAIPVIEALVQEARTESRSAMLHHMLGACLFDTGRYRRSSNALEVALEQYPADAVDQKKQCKNMLDTSNENGDKIQRLTEILAGTAEFTGNQERLELARFCAMTARRYATAARLLQEALRLDPSLNQFANNPFDVGSLAAANAAYGLGLDGGDLTEDEKLEMLQLARHWLIRSLEVDYEPLPLDKISKRDLGYVLGSLNRLVELPWFARMREPESLERWPLEEQEAWAQAIKRVEGFREKLQDRIEH